MKSVPILLCAGALLAGAFRHAAAQFSPDGAVSTAAGVYTTAQATRGEGTYMNMCVGCHPAGTYATAAFREKWHGRPLSELYLLVSDTMPKQDPASLPPDEYAQTVAYLLKINDVPSGKTELPADVEALKKITIEMPAPGKKDK
jgi:mono/diheme cytochrome c family protein